MRFWWNGREEWIPADWSLYITQEGSRFRVTVRRQGRSMTVPEALILRDLETTSSKPHNKVSVLPVRG